MGPAPTRTFKDARRWFSTRRAARTTETGAAIVEASLVTPLFLVLIFGIIELGPLFLNWSATRTASTAAAREGSISGSDPRTDYYVLRGVKKFRGSSLGAFQSAIVWKAPDPDAETPVDCMEAAKSKTVGVVGKCNIYYLADLDRPVTDFGQDPVLFPSAIDQYWDPSGRSDVLTGPPDLVGVTVITEHRSLLGVLPNWLVKETTIIPIEARRSGV
jgi:TadE-like protein